MQKIIPVEALKNGLFDELQQKLFAEALADIKNEEKPADAKRVITLKYSLSPSPDRQCAKVTLEGHLMIAPLKPIATTLFIESKGDQFIAFDKDPNQQEIPVEE